MDNENTLRTIFPPVFFDYHFPFPPPPRKKPNGHDACIYIIRREILYLSCSSLLV